MSLFLRKYTLSVGDAEVKDEDNADRVAQGISALNVTFEVQKTAEAHPDSAVVKVYNPPEIIIQSAQRLNSAMRLEAGYKDSDFSDNRAIIFQGFIRKADVENLGVDTVLTLEAGDGDDAYRLRQVAQSFAPGTRLRNVGERLLQKIKTGGVSVQAAKKQIERLIGSSTHRTSKDEATKGVCYTGSASQNFSQFLRKYKVRWTVQDGVVKISENNKVSAQFPTAVVLSPDTGLIGTPQPGNNGTIKLRSLLQAGLKPFRQLEIRGSAKADGVYVIDKVKHSGEYYGSPWYSEIEAVPIS